MKKYLTAAIFYMLFFIAGYGLSLAGVSLSGLDGAVIDSLSISGPDSVTAAEILKNFLSAKGQVLNSGLVEHDIETAAVYLRENGWWHSEIEPFVEKTAAGHVSLRYDIKMNKPVITGMVEIVRSGQAKVSYGKLYGKILTKDILESVLSGEINNAVANGYPEVTAIPGFESSGDTLNVAITVDPGKKANVDSISIKGLTRTRINVIEREMKSLKGRPAGVETVDYAAALLSEISFVGSSGHPVMDYDESGRGVLTLFLTEGSQGTFDGVLGYQPDSEGNGKVVGKIDLSLENMFGTGRYSKLKWESLGEQTEDMEFIYREPWIFGFPYNIAVSFCQEERGLSGYTKTLMNADVERHIGKMKLNAGLEYEKASADSSASSSAKGIGTGITWNGTDNSLNPGKGIRYSLGWEYLTKESKFENTGNSHIERIKTDLEHYIPIIKRQTLAANFSYRTVNIPLRALSLSDRYWVGGSSTIRGYREKSVPAVNAIWTNLEYRFLTGTDSRIFLFVDAGYITDKEKDTASETLRYDTVNSTLVGYGFGIRVKSQSGELGFDYGMEKGSGLGSGKLHLRLITDF